MRQTNHVAIYHDMCLAGAEVVETIGRDNARHTASRGGRTDSDFPAFIQGADILGPGRDQRTTVEDVDIAVIVEAFPFQQLARTTPIAVGLSDDVTCAFRQQVDIEKVLRSQIQDELVVRGRAERIGLVEIHAEEGTGDVIEER